MRKRIGQSKEVTTSDVSGARITVPPGVYYRGEVMSKHEALDKRRRDHSTEVRGPYLDTILTGLEEALDVTQEG